MLPYVFVRSFNIRHCEWCEIDFENRQWIIPASKMKTKTEFILPLANQVIEILKEVQQFTGTGKYVFPSFIKKDKPMSDNTLIGALRRMGYTKEEFVPHSFRAMFSTIAYENINEHQCSGEVIEALLAHKETNKVKDAYNRATYKEGMRKLIEWYTLYLKRIIT
jgi:integrase